MKRELTEAEKQQAANAMADNCTLNSKMEMDLEYARGYCEALSSLPSAETIRQLEEENKRLKEGGWISVDRDDLPPGQVLCRNAYYDYMVGGIETYFSTQPPFCVSEGGERMDNVTHWQPLPVKPSL